IADMQSGMEAQAGAAPIVNVAGLTKMVEGMVGMVNDLDKLEVVGKLAEDGFQLHFTLHAKKDSETGKLFASMDGMKAPSLAAAPANAPLVVAANIDPAKYSDLSKRLMSLSLDMINLGDEAKKTYETATDAYLKAMTGDFVMVGYPNPGEPKEGELNASLSAKMGIKDAEAAKAAQVEIGKIYKDPTFAKAYKDAGIEMKYTPQAYKVGEVEVATAVTEMKGLDDAGASAGMVGLMKAFSTVHTGIGKEAAYMAYGPAGKAILTQWIEGKMPGGFDGSDGAKRAMSHAVPGMFAVVFAAPAAVMPAVMGKPLPEKGGEGLSMTMGAKDGRIHLGFDVPKSQIMALMAVGQGTMVEPGGAPGGI
ncbi:MAG: hypothetical protein AAGA56_16310, partial [Myxococcota bacterium]